jgi:hypothetical protein
MARSMSRRLATRIGCHLDLEPRLLKLCPDDGITVTGPARRSRSLGSSGQPGVRKTKYVSAAPAARVGDPFGGRPDNGATAAQHPVAFAPEDPDLGVDDVPRHVVLSEDPGEDLDRGLELLRDDVAGPDLQETVDLRGVSGPDDDEDVRIEVPGRLDAPPRHLRVGDGEDDGFRLLDAGLFEDGRAGDVAEDDELALGGRSPDRYRVELEDDVREAGLLEDVGEVPPVEPEPGDDDVVREVAAGLPGVFGPPSSTGRRAPRSARPGETWMRARRGDGQDEEAMKAWKIPAETVGPADAGQVGGEPPIWAGPDWLNGVRDPYQEPDRQDDD